VPLPIHIAIVSLTREVTTRSLLQVTAAVQKQVTRDLEPIWGVTATVDTFGDLVSIPNDYLPVVVFGDPDELADQLVNALGAAPAKQLLDELEQESVAGIHLNALTRQPFALVSANGAWTVVLSHEVIEMLCDPWGNRLVAGPHPLEPQRRVKYLLEVCDPCQSVWYPVNGVPVTDFYTPRYFDPVALDMVRYSFTGSITRPRQVIEGGYLTYLDPTDSQLYQLSGDSDRPALLTGMADLARSTAPLRTIVDANPRTPRIREATLQAADSADAGDLPYAGVAEAAAGAAMSTAGALYTLATGTG
jgi:hypothetical protein